MRRALGLLLAASPCLLAACGSTRGLVSSAPADVLQRAISADNRGDIEGVLSCYANDAVLVPPRGSRVEGLDAIRERYASAFAAFRFDLHCDTNDVSIDGRQAWARGETRGRLISKTDGNEVVVHDTFLAVLQLDDAHTWRIARLAWRPAEAERSSN